MEWDWTNPINVIAAIVVVVLIVWGLLWVNRPCKPSYDSFTGTAYVCVNGQPCNVNTQNCDVPTTSSP
jgi:hypothetical protein